MHAYRPLPYLNAFMPLQTRPSTTAIDPTLPVDFHASHMLHFHDANETGCFAAIENYLQVCGVYDKDAMGAILDAGTHGRTLYRLLTYQTETLEPFGPVGRMCYKEALVSNKHAFEARLSTRAQRSQVSVPLLVDRIRQIATSMAACGYGMGFVTPEGRVSGIPQSARQLQDCHVFNHALRNMNAILASV